MILSAKFFKHIIFLIFNCYFFLALVPAAQAQSIPGTQTEQQEEQKPQIPEDSLGRRNPRGTVIGFIRAVSAKNYERGSRFLNVSPIIDNEEEAVRLVQTFQTLLDRGGNILPYSRISSEATGRIDDDLPPGVDRVGTLTAGDETINLFVEETKGNEGNPIWLFSTETLNAISQLNIQEPLLAERILPPFLKNNYWYGVPIGQWLGFFLIMIASYFVAWGLMSLLIFILLFVWRKARLEPTKGIIRALALPFRIFLAVWIFVISAREIGISIILRQMFSAFTVVIIIVAFLILLWRLTDFIGNFSRHRMNINGNPAGISVILFLRRAVKIAIIVFGLIAVLGTLGVNVTTGLAALGIGGLALALGAQKTLENLVGSVTLIADQPVRIGDVCKVGDTTGIVEKIGMRSTRIRTFNRTVVTIPNGQFSSEKIENLSHRDRFLFGPVLDLRYETSPDQIRFLLVEIRSILYAHPMVNPDPARVRFIELAGDSIKIEVYSYIDAPNFNVYLEVKEDLLLRIMDIVAASGTDFAFPSQTVYLARDKGLAKDKVGSTEEKVKQWKEKNEMQIPNFDPENIDKLKNTIPYPPKGSSAKREEGEELF